MIGCAGIDRVLTVDLHADQIRGFFNVPVDNVYASPVLLGEVWKQKYQDMIVVSPDVGGVVRARALARRLDNADLAIIDKRRARANESQVMNIIGDVRDRSCVLVDDLVDTAGTLCQAAAALKQQGARRVAAYITHAVLSGPAVERIADSALDELVVTDTIPLRPDAEACRRIRVLPVAGLLPRRCGACATRSRSVPVRGYEETVLREAAAGGPVAPWAGCRCLVAGRSSHNRE